MISLVVFDLDFTLWDAGGSWCDHTNPPYKRVTHHIEDTYGSKIVLYNDVQEILQKIAKQEITMALASRTGAPLWARQLLKLFEIDHYFDYKEIYPGSKVEHFQQLQHLTNTPFEEMLFFDDEMRNIHEVGALGVNAVYVEDGVNKQLLETYLELD